MLNYVFKFWKRRIEMQREAEIRFLVSLDEENVPLKIQWDATHSDIEGMKPCNATMISIWDSEKKNTLSIDLWTKDLTVEEINIHYFQTIMKMADTYQRATNNKGVAEMIRTFGSEFADKAVKEFRVSK